MADRKSFFSLIELLTVMAVIAILLAITIGVFSLARDKMNNSKTRAIIKQLDIAMQSYKLEQGYYFFNGTAYPTLPADLKPNSLQFNFAGINTPDMDFIKCFEYQTLKGKGSILTTTGYSYFIDSWGTPILYKYPGIFNPQMFDIGSLGKDGKYGDNSNSSNDFGKGDDITNFNNN